MFTNRLMFPICDRLDRVIGFGGRSLDNSTPKYINSSENNFFKKRNILYNMNNLKMMTLLLMGTPKKFDFYYQSVF